MVPECECIFPEDHDARKILTELCGEIMIQFESMEMDLQFTFFSEYLFRDLTFAGTEFKDDLLFL